MWKYARHALILRISEKISSAISTISNVLRKSSKEKPSGLMDCRHLKLKQKRGRERERERERERASKMERLSGENGIYATIRSTDDVSVENEIRHGVPRNKSDRNVRTCIFGTMVDETGSSVVNAAEKLGMECSFSTSESCRLDEEVGRRNTLKGIRKTQRTVSAPWPRRSALVQISRCIDVERSSEGDVGHSERTRVIGFTLLLCIVIGVDIGTVPRSPFLR